MERINPYLRQDQHQLYEELKLIFEPKKPKKQPKDFLDILLFSDDYWVYYCDLYNTRYTNLEFSVISFGTLEYWLFLRTECYKNNEIRKVIYAN